LVSPDDPKFVTSDVLRFEGGFAAGPENGPAYQATSAMPNHMRAEFSSRHRANREEITLSNPAPAK
jgi:hypothetical protein